MYSIVTNANSNVRDNNILFLKFMLLFLSIMFTNNFIFSSVPKSNILQLIGQQHA